MKKILILFVSLCFCVTLFAQKKIKVACVGNSITYGYTLPDRETNAYPAKLQKMLGDDYVVGNFGKSGATLLNKGHRPYMQQRNIIKLLILPVISLLSIWVLTIQIRGIGLIIVISLFKIIGR